MKMKKSTWLLLVLAIAAIFLVAGCAPTGPAPTPPDENGEEPPPTPPADTKCPEVVKTEVSKLFDPDGRANFQIVITFDENIESTCIQNPANWTIEVANKGRITSPIGANPISIAVDGKVVTVKAWVAETYDVTWLDLERAPAGFTFVGYFDTLEEAIDYVDEILWFVDRWGAPDVLTSLGVTPFQWSRFLDTVEIVEEAQSLAAEAIRLAASPNAAALTNLATAATNLAGEADLPPCLINGGANGGVREVFGREFSPSSQSHKKTIAPPDLFSTLLTNLATAATAEPFAANALRDAARDVEDELLPALECILDWLGVIVVEETETFTFEGLICNKDDAKAYADTFSVDAPTVADEVTWTLSNGCVVSDELGNFCCGYTDKDCCEEPYCEPCEECVLEEVVCY